MNTPKTIQEAISISVNAMLRPLAIPQAKIDAGLSALFDELENGTRAAKDAVPVDRVVPTKEACALLSRCPKTLCELAKRGKIRAVYTGKDSKRAFGYTAASINAFLDGKAA